MRTPPPAVVALLGAVVAMAAAAGTLSATDLGSDPTIDENRTVSLTPDLKTREQPGPRNAAETPGQTGAPTPCGLHCDGPDARSLLSMVSVPSSAVVALLVGLLGTLAVVRLRGRRPEVSPDGDDPLATADPVTGDAPTDTSDGAYDAPDDEVVRYWRRLTATVDADDPATTTPREYERLAVAAGHDAAAVATLIGAFEARRYGTRLTEDRRVQAREAAVTLGLDGDRS